MDWTFFMSSAQAERIAKLESSDISTIIQIATMSQKAEDIVRIARGIRDGQEPDIPDGVLSSAPKTLHIIAHSFVRDKKQYNATYGLSDEKAAQLAKMLHSDPHAASEEIKRLVSQKLRSKGSERAVEVMLTQAPMPKPAASNSIALDGDGGARELATEIAKRPGIYGQYQFEPEPTGLAGQFQYGIHLGDDLFVIGQSKKLVIAAARICRVKGRSDEMVEPYVWYWVSWASPVRESDMPETVWDGMQSALAPIKPRKTKEIGVQTSRKRSFAESELVAEDVD